MCKTTSPAIVNFTEKVRKILPPCPAEQTGKMVKVVIYDPGKLIEGRSDLINALAQVQVFYNGLHQVPGLPAILANELGNYTFQVKYKAGSPDASEIKNMGRMDFPLYVFNSPGLSPNLTSEDEIKALMEKYQLSALSQLRVLFNNLDLPPQLKVTEPFLKSIEDSWGNKLVLGFGFPGNYYAKGTCHKLGIIKIDAVENNKPVNMSSADRFRGVIKHELGHMLSLKHEPGTIMSEKYEGDQVSFTTAQIDVIRDTLKKLSP